MYNKYVIYYIFHGDDFVYFVLLRAPFIESSIFKVTLAPDYLYILHYIVTFTVVSHLAKDPRHFNDRSDSQYFY